MSAGHLLRNGFTAVMLAASETVSFMSSASPAQLSAAQQSTVVSSPPTFLAERFDRIVLGGPLVDNAMAMASCTRYAPANLANSPMVFDGTVFSISPGRTDTSSATGVSARRAVSFRVHKWFRGGGGGAVVVDFPQPVRVDLRHDQARWSYQIGTRLLVSTSSPGGRGGAAGPIAASCGFTRYYSPGRAVEWAAATA